MACFVNFKTDFKLNYLPDGQQDNECNIAVDIFGGFRSGSFDMEC